MKTVVKQHERARPYSRRRAKTTEDLLAGCRQERERLAEQALKKALPKLGAGISKALAEALANDPEFARRIAEGS